MFYVYILQKDKHFYIGYTNSLTRRMRDHKFDRRKDYELIYFEGYKNEIDARNREKSLKHFGSGLGLLKKRIAHSINNG